MVSNKWQAANSASGGAVITILYSLRHTNEQLQRFPFNKLSARDTLNEHVDKMQFILISLHPVKALLIDPKAEDDELRSFSARGPVAVSLPDFTSGDNYGLHTIGRQ